MSKAELDNRIVDEAFASNSQNSYKPSMSDKAVSSPKIMKLATFVFVGIILLLVAIMVFVLVDGRHASGGKDSLAIANAYVDAITSGKTDDFYAYIPNEASNRQVVLDQMAASYSVNSEANLKYGDDASFRVGEPYAKDQVDEVKSSYGLETIDEIRDVRYSASYTAVVDNTNVNGEEIVVITTIKVGDSWFYLHAKDVKNRYKREGSSMWTDLMASPTGSDEFYDTQSQPEEDAGAEQSQEQSIDDTNNEETVDDSGSDVAKE